jgi:C1A family cysteine protease
MAHFEPQGFGWLPSVPDFRDYHPESPPARELLKRLGDRGTANQARATSVDLRDFFVDVYDQLTLNASTANACAGLVQYFERRANGRLLRPSRLFLYQNTLRLAGASGDVGADLRTTLKAMICCGIPPERYWPYEIDRFPRQPDAFLFSFDQPYRAVNYVRLDSPKSSGMQNLQMVKSFLAAGFPAAFGFGVPNTLSDDGNIPYRPTFDSTAGGQAMLAVGYDDRWLRGSRGALLVRSSWGNRWGEEGYGWLPYAYVEEHLALDFFTLLHPAWINSGEFDAPAEVD